MPEGVREISEGGKRERSMPERMTREAGAVIDIAGSTAKRRRRISRGAPIGAGGAADNAMACGAFPPFVRTFAAGRTPKR